MTESSQSPSLRRFAVFTAAATLILICAGGVVTSKGAGLSVPDWPTTYGYNMFFFPVSKWVGGIFYEHTHRLIASAVGLLTAILALWLFGYKSRPLTRWGGLALVAAGVATAVFLPARRPDAVFLFVAGAAAFSASFFWPSRPPAPAWMRRLGVIALIAVVVQGVLGGLRVTELMSELGIFHATLAQLFFALICAMALFTTRWWANLASVKLTGGGSGWLLAFVLATTLVLAQLIIGATMRHQHAGLAVPDFPLAYGRLWPAMDAESVAQYNRDRVEVTALNLITPAQIGLHMAHRIVAAVILVTVALVACGACRRFGTKNPLTRLSLAWLCLVLLQAFLGATAVWTNKAADVATAHVALGAMTLATGAILSLVAFRLSAHPAKAGAWSPAWPENEPAILPQASIAAGRGQ